MPKLPTRQISTLGFSCIVAAMLIAPQQADTKSHDRSGEEVVEKYCGACHQSGQGGAPRVGDKEAWIPRLQHGLPFAIRSAIKGHGGMPPRGGAVNLTDAEIRNAIVYMFDPEAATASRSACCPMKKQAGPAGANHAHVGGIHIYLGFVPAENLRGYPRGSVERSMHGGLPSGDNWYHVNVTLLEQAAHAPITGARVEARVRSAVPAKKWTELEPMAIGRGSYGNYFRLKSEVSYRVTVRVLAPGSADPVEAEFQYKHL